jgi:hypothetical protein
MQHSTPEDGGARYTRQATNHFWRQPGDHDLFPEKLRLAEAESSWSAVLDLFSDTHRAPTPGRERVAAMGDIHGASPDEVRADLRRLGFLDRYGHWRNRYDIYFIQTGDVIDRGSRGREVYDLLGELQSQAGGHMIRLLGNHEEFHLLAIPEHLRAPKLPGFREQLIDDVLSGRLVLAWTEGDVIYSHAGIDLNFYPEYRGRSNADIVTDLNARLVAAVQEIQTAREEIWADGFKRHAFAQHLMAQHTIFDPDHGILWTRGDIENEQFRQVVGHTPQLDGIKATPGMRVKYIDAGRVFGEQGMVDPDRARSVMTNTAIDPGLRYLAAHPEVYRQHEQDDRQRKNEAPGAESVE